MTIEPLKRSLSPAILKPNPMWIISPAERRILEDKLLPHSSEQGRAILYGALDCWDSYLNQAVNNIRVLSSFIKENPERAILSLHRETTVNYASHINIDGTQTFYPASYDGSFRTYFDGYSFKTRNDLGHVSVACVDFQKKHIWFQDSQGIPTKQIIRKAFEEYFYDFETTDLMLKQQWDPHSCSVITLYNQECFAKGELPFGFVNVSALRSRYMAILDRYDESKSQTKSTKYYTKPPTQIRYTPI